MQPNLNPALSRFITNFATRVRDAGFHLHTTRMNYTTLIPTFVFVLMTITALVEAAPNGAEKGARRDTPQNAPTESREEFLKKHPEIREKFEKLKDMSPEERRAFFKDHPEFAEKIKEHAKDGAKDATPDSRADFLKDHPELKEHLEKLKSMTPEERQAWLKAHPEAAEKIEKAKAKFKEKAEDATPEQKEKLKAKLKERFEKMTPEQQAEVLKNHPELKEKLEGAKKYSSPSTLPSRARHNRALFIGRDASATRPPCPHGRDAVARLPMHLLRSRSPCQQFPSLNAALGRVQRNSPIISTKFLTTISEASFWTTFVPNQVS